jgi:kynurenine formamidase
MPTMEEFRSVAAAVRNWGRWGSDDQLGTLNLLTAETTRSAAAAVRTGKSYSLATPIQSDGVWPADSFRRNAIHLMTIDGGEDAIGSSELTAWGSATATDFAQRWENNLLRFTDDFVMMPLQCASHWDALAHVYYDGQLYNGYPASTVSSFGASKNSIARVAERGLVARGVLLDVARFRGVTCLPLGAVITSEELAAVVDAEKVQILPGDVLLIHTGWWADPLRLTDRSRWIANAPGLDWLTAEWLFANDIAAVASDNLAVETSVPTFADVRLPLHLLCLRDMGMSFGELWCLGNLADACATDGDYAFQLHATPLLVTGAVGAPVAPVAIK